MPPGTTPAKKKRTRKRPTFDDIDAWIKSQPVTERRKLRRLLKELKKLVKQPQRDDLAWWHDVGTLALEFFPKGDRQYGVGVVELLADYLKPGRERRDKTTTILLYRARQLADTFTSREVRALGKKRTAGGDLLKLRHVTSLLAVDDRDERNALLAKCLAKNWSVARLRRKIQNRHGRKRSAGGLSPVPPDNPSPGVALRDISILSRRWMTNCHVWFVGRKPALKKIPVKDRDEAMLKELRQAEDGLIEVAGAVKQGLVQIEKLAREVEGTVKSRPRKRGGRKRGTPA